jgi:hypothetical protein
LHRYAPIGSWLFSYYVRRQHRSNNEIVVLLRTIWFDGCLSFELKKPNFGFEFDHKVSGTSISVLSGQRANVLLWYMLVTSQMAGPCCYRSLGLSASFSIRGVVLSVQIVVVVREKKGGSRVSHFEVEHACGGEKLPPSNPNRVNGVQSSSSQR